jgi:hypothetical protein
LSFIILSNISIIAFGFFLFIFNSISLLVSKAIKNISSLDFFGNALNNIFCISLFIAFEVDSIKLFINGFNSVAGICNFVSIFHHFHQFFSTNISHLGSLLSFSLNCFV